MKAFKTMLGVELKLSLRDMNMVIFALCMPAVAVVILGILFGTKPAYDGADFSFLEQSMGALSSIAICAGGAMGLPILISDYRERKILKRFQVTPVSPANILGVEIAIYALYSAASVVVNAVLGAAFFGVRLPAGPLPFLGGWLLTMACMFSIGTLVGGVAKNSKQASVIASILYFPMLIFSGATLPYEVMPRGLQIAAELMPLTHGVKLMKAGWLGLPLSAQPLPLILMIALTVLCGGLAVKWFRWE